MGQSQERPGLVAIQNITGSVFAGPNNLISEHTVTSGAAIHSDRNSNCWRDFEWRRHSLNCYEPVYMDAMYLISVLI